MSDLDLGHLDALWVQGHTESVPLEQRVTFLAGIGELWPEIRLKLVELRMSTITREDIDALDRAINEQGPDAQSGQQEER